jgi:hypothetical protein
MHPCLKQLFRSLARFIAFLLLLTLSGAMLGIGINVLVCAKEQTAQLEASYTTVAVPDYRTQTMIDAENRPHGEAKSVDEMLAYFQEIQTRKELIALAKTAAEASPFVQLADNRQIAAVYVPGSLPITSGSSDPLAFEENFDEPYNLAIFTVICTDIRQAEQVGQTITASAADCSDSTTLEYTYLTYEASASVEECVLLNDAYAPPDTLKITGDILSTDGNIPLTVGKRYLIWGVYYAPQIIQVGLNEWEIDPDDVPALTLGHDMLYPGGFAEEDFQLLNGKNHAAKHMLEKYPICIELPDGMNAEAFLTSAAGEAWKSVRELCDVTYQSVPVIATQKLESMLEFNTNQTPIIEGRSFTEEEYKSVAKVCVIGSEYAVKNGLHIGDTLSLSFYDASIYPSEIPLRAILLTVVGPYLPDTQRSEADSYTVIGLYQSTGFRLSNYSFSPNTVFLPGGEAALPENLSAESSSSQELSVTTLPVLYSLVLKNGSVELFEQEMAEQGFVGCFLYYDQDYAHAQVSIETLANNASRLFAFCSALGVVSTLLYALLYALWARRTAVSMRLIGVRRSTALGEATTGAALTALIALPFGALAGYLLFNSAAALVFNAGSAIRYSLGGALLAAAAQLMLSVLASLGFSAGILIKNPLKLLGKAR